MTISAFYNNVKAHGNLAKIPRYGESQTGVLREYRRVKRTQAELRNKVYQDLKHAVRKARPENVEVVLRAHDKATPLLQKILYEEDYWYNQRYDALALTDYDTRDVPDGNAS